MAGKLITKLEVLKNAPGTQSFLAYFLQTFEKIRGANPFTLTIRAKLVIVSLSLLIIPWVGYQYVNEMELYLREKQEQSLLDRARIVASVLGDQPGLFVTQTTAATSDTTKHLYVRPLQSPMQMDGYSEDWNDYKEFVFHFSEINVTNKSTQSNIDALSFRFQIGSFNPFLYALFQVSDDHLVFRPKSGSRIDNADHLQIAMQTPSGDFARFVVSAKNEGRMTVYRLPTGSGNDLSVSEEPQIAAFIRKRNEGYNIEIRMPLGMLGDKIAFAIADVDDEATRKIKTIVRTTGTRRIEDIGTIVVPSPEIDTLLKRLHRTGSRMWVMDKNAKVIALNGSLKEEDKDVYEVDADTKSATKSFMSRFARSFYQAALKEPAKEFHDDLSTASQLTTPEVLLSLQGQPTARWRQTPDERVNILTAAYPVKDKNKIVGSVAIEETSNSILILQNRAVEILINLSMLALAVAAVTVFAFATRLSIRVRRLRDSADSAIGSDGRVVGNVVVSRATDEIGDLSRSIGDMLNRLAEYNRYLETMASKLSHELRTPITVVRSSLENLEGAHLNEEYRAYTQRAKEGVERLSNILTRMSEATRLEQTIQQEDRAEFNLEKLIQSCINGYQIANQNQPFKFIKYKPDPRKPVTVIGVPDLIAQLLDKLVSNAMDFALEHTPIVVILMQNPDNVQIQVINDGPTLPDKMKNNLFDSMVSMRDKRGKQPHLGLGLYIVRLIAEFHRGQVSASNKVDNSGVVFTVVLPKSD